MTSLETLLQSVIQTGNQIPGQVGTQDALNLAAATLQMAQAYNVLKESELHERFHLSSEGGVLLPGEGGPISDRGAN